MSLCAGGVQENNTGMKRRSPPKKARRAWLTDGDYVLGVLVKAATLTLLLYKIVLMLVGGAS
jgi:hypothetical protein